LTKAATVSANGNPLAFIEIQAIFGDLNHFQRFVETYLSCSESIRKYGVKKAIMNIK
jgi:hypothetical protein